MKNKILLIILIIISFPTFAQYSVQGGAGVPLKLDNKEYEIPLNTQFYLLYGLTGGQISYTSTSEGQHQWYRYSKKLSDREPIPSQQTGKTSIITNISGNYGYFVEGSLQPAIWITDYSQYVPKLNSLEVDQSDYNKCTSLKLLANIQEDKIVYYSADETGISREIKRRYQLAYQTMDWDEDNLMFYNTDVDTTLVSPISSFFVDAPLRNTDFELRGDNFASYFGIDNSVKTPEYEAVSVQAEAELYKSTDTDRPDNEIKTDGDGAPLDVTLTAYANEPVATFYNWKIFKKNGTILEPVTRFSQKVFHYTFEQSGSYVAQLEVSDQNSICVNDKKSFEITITTSKLDVPNVFTPGSSPGVNDIFKVSYKSITKFRAWIFNRWGNQLFQWNDPSQGWDGTYNGKLVPPGVYFYVIEAERTDGQKPFKLKGSVNVIRGK